MIADWHALTTEYGAKTNILGQVQEIGIDFLAGGLDPEKSVIFVQSRIPEHAELALILSMITPLAWLERNPTYKDQVKELAAKELATHGFLGYPVLQTADILLYQADKVPVGADQLPHLELAREITRRFHHLYKSKIFTEPESELTRVTKLPGTDGRKMSKSYGNAIFLSDSPEQVTKKVKGMMTDPARKLRSDPGNPEICPVYYYYKVFNPAGAETVALECRQAQRGCVDCKSQIVESVKAVTTPIYEARCAWAEKKAEVHEILVSGTEKAGKIAQETMARVRDAVGI